MLAKSTNSNPPVRKTMVQSLIQSAAYPVNPTNEKQSLLSITLNADDYEQFSAPRPIVFDGLKIIKKGINILSAVFVRLTGTDSTGNWLEQQLKLFMYRILQIFSISVVMLWNSSESSHQTSQWCEKHHLYQRSYQRPYQHLLAVSVLHRIHYVKVLFTFGVLVLWYCLYKVYPFIYPKFKTTNSKNNFLFLAKFFFVTA